MMWLVIFLSFGRLVNVHILLDTEKSVFSPVESGCLPVGCRFDKGAESCGYFQIKEPYYIDCGSPGSNWHHCADDLECSSRCVQAYMDRYIDYSGCDYTCESYARIHAGGPRGCADPATITYWHKVQSHGCT